MMSLPSVPSGWRNLSLMSRYVTISSPKSFFEMISLAFIVDWRKATVLSAPRGNIANTSIFASGNFSRSFSDDHLDALGDFARRAGAVVRADHQHGQLGRDAVDVAVVETPEDVFDAVAAEAQVHGVAFRIILAPDLLAAAFPAVGDRVADK